MSCLKFIFLVIHNCNCDNEKSTKKKIRKPTLGSSGKLSLLELVHKSVISPGLLVFWET